MLSRLSTTCQRRVQVPWLLVISSLGCAYAVLAIAAPLARSAGLPPGVTQAQVTGNFAFLWGEPEVAINPKNPNNLVYAVLGNGDTSACQAEAATNPDSNCAMVSDNELFVAYAAGNRTGMLTAVRLDAFKR